MNWYKIFTSQDEIKQFQHLLVNKYPGLDLELWDNGHSIELAVIELPKDKRNQGLGTAIVQEIQAYAAQKGLPVVLRPTAEQGKKEALDRFYKNLGFVPNRGRNKNYQLSSPFAATMYWEPQK